MFSTETEVKYKSTLLYPEILSYFIHFLIAKFRLKLKKAEKTIRPFRCDLNQIPYNYTVEVGNRFKGLDLIECLKNYGWMF